MATSRKAKELGERARSNLKAAYQLYKQGYYNESSQLAHDAAEKALKAFLIKANIDMSDLQYKHDLVPLLERACQKYPQLAPFKEGAEKTDINYMPSRYPGGGAIRVTSQSAKSDCEYANSICTPLFKAIDLDVIEK